MAKKAPAEDKPKDAAAEAAPAKDAKEGKEPREGKEAREGKDTKEKKPKEPKAKTKPDAPAAAKAEKPTPAATKPAAPAPEGGAAAPAATAAAPAEAKKKGKRPGTAPMRGKKLRNHLNNLKQRILKEGPVPLNKAVGLLKQMKRAKFDETVEIHVALAVDTSQTDQAIRGTVSLPHGIGKSVRVLVFCQGDNVAKAKAAGADHAGSDEFLQKIQKENWLDFDVALATQDMMGQVSRLGKVLGPRGLMPTPKAGTVVTAGQDVATVVREFKAGKVEFRSDKGGNVHAGVGKISFDEQKLADNISAFLDQIRASKPAGVKGHFIKSATVCATMSPGVPVAVA